MIKTIFCFCCLIFMISFLNSCDYAEIYKVGNRRTLDYVIETKINFKILRIYLNKIIQMQEHQVPEKWVHYDKLIDIDSIDTKRIYFKNNPEEMYLMQFNGVLLLADVFNENIVKGDWVSNRKNITVNEEERIKKRFKVEVLNRIELMAKKDNVPDSILYLSPFSSSVGQ